MNEIRRRDAVSHAPQILAFLRAAQFLEGRLEEAMADVGLSTARFGVLAQLAEAGEPLPLGVLAERLSCVRSNVTQLVDRLEADGLVRRVPDPSDRRSVRWVDAGGGGGGPAGGGAGGVRRIARGGRPRRAGADPGRDRRFQIKEG